MQCDRARELIGSYIDGELAGAERQAIADHLLSCAGCTALVQDLKRIGRQVAEAGREPAPKALALRIRAALAEEAAANTQEHAGVSPNAGGSLQVRRLPTSLQAPWARGFMRQAAAFVAACALSSVLTWAAINWSSTAARLGSEVVSAHIRSLLQDSPIQVASSDAHTVKPWFSGRIDFAPEVKDLTPEGFPLAGGRLDYIGERRVGAIVYRRRMHVVNVFMWPAPNAEAQPPRLETVRGYNVLSWNIGGITYCAVSDLNAGELRQLQALL